MGVLLSNFSNVALTSVGLVQIVQIDCAWKEQPPPFAKQDFNYHHKLVGPTRTDIKPLDIIQPEGPSFTVSLLISAQSIAVTTTAQVACTACSSSVKASGTAALRSAALVA